MNESRKLRVLHTESSCGWGGQEIRILTEMEGMIGRGYELQLLCPAESTIYDVAKKHDLPVTALPIARKNVRGLLSLRKWLKRNRVDVVITHSSTDSWLTAVACQTMLHPPRIIRLRHVSASVPNNFPTRWLYQHACEHIVTTGTCIREQLVKENGFAPHRITSIPTGLDLQKFSPGDREAARKELGLPVSKHLIGIIATLRSWKGHAHLIEAFSRLIERHENLHLLIVGEGPVREPLETLVEELNLKQEVTFAGNQENTVPWFRSIDTFVLPSYANEGVPQALMQAMACGLPVIGGAVGGLPETIEDGKTGLLFPPKDVPALVAAIEKLLENSEFARQMGDAAAQVAREKFGIDLMLDKMGQVIENAMKS